MPKDRILRVRELGAHGVNLVETPLHLAENELVAAQNAELSLNTGELAIRKRLGLSPFVDALAGPVFAIVAVPLEDPSGGPVTSTTVIMLHGDNGDGRFGTAEAGSIANIDPPYRGAGFALSAVTARLGSLLLYGEPSGAFWSGRLLAYDTVAESTSVLCALSPLPATDVEILGLLTYGGQIYVAYRDDLHSYVVRFVNSEGWVPSVMLTTDFRNLSIATFNSLIYVAYYNGAEFPWQTRVYSCPPNESTWTEELMFFSNYYADPSIVGSSDDLWIAFQGSPNKVWRLTSGGASELVYSNDDAFGIRLLGAVGTACYWMEWNALDGNVRVKGTVNEGGSVVTIAEYPAVYEFTVGIVSDGKVYFVMTETRSTGPWLCQEISGLELSTRFTVVSGDNDYVGAGGVG